MCDRMSAKLEPEKGGRPTSISYGNHAERILIARARQLARVTLLGAHVHRRAHDRARLRLIRALGHFGNAKIGDDRFPVGIQENVPGLDIAMDHAPTVRITERCPDLEQPGANHRNRKRADVAQHALQRPARHELHDEEVQVADLSDAVDRHDVDMLQARDGDRFLFEALHHPLGRAGGRAP